VYVPVRSRYWPLRVVVPCTRIFPLRVVLFGFLGGIVVMVCSVSVLQTFVLVSVQPPVKSLLLLTVVMVRWVLVLRCKRSMLMAFGVCYLVLVVVASLCSMADVVVSCLVSFRIVLSFVLPAFSSLQFVLPVVVVVTPTDVFFLILVVLFQYRMLILFLILLCRVDFFAFLDPSAAYLLPDFFVLFRLLVVVVGFRRTVLLAEVLAGLVVEAVVDLVVCHPVGVVVLVVPEAVVDMVAVVVVADPWGCIP
jgi:hypothetical protein